MLAAMEPKFTGTTAVLPAADTEESLRWWTQICGYTEAFRDATPANYAGISRGESFLHISGIGDKVLARTIGDQTMVRISVEGIDAYYAEFQERGGKVHPNGPLQSKPWGSREFAAIDPNGVCVTFRE
jgi:predicted enzyme related to lactoylglutathione lyase